MDTYVVHYSKNENNYITYNNNLLFFTILLFYEFSDLTGKLCAMWRW